MDNTTPPRAAASGPDLDGAPCPVCHVGRLHRAVHTETLERGGAVVVVRGVPGWSCDACGESYTDEATTQKLLALAEGAFARQAEIEVVRFGAAA